ncbi:hypothetical protein SPI_09403 [Niveomyces insectorum RCEF 264]|uniref:K Homology domain-containing protein n=1 Tax=Niveomyces insectorum RCEF 264 TaxID=1081102 RepID=A0A162I7U0_9HYPO|nr:hypothetical protein SPI_09403 [Niveomyces insectorum RCEF 264]
MDNATRIVLPGDSVDPTALLPLRPPTTSAAAAGLAFETAVGRNGRLWVNSGDARTTVLVGRAVTATDAQNLDARQQQALVRTLVRGGGGS